MITEDYVSFETAKLLKEKGFDSNTNCYYIEDFKDLFYSPIRENHNASIENNEFDIDINISSGKMSAPTLQMAMKWLREVHNYDISICLDSYVEPYDNEYYIVIRRRKDRFEEISPCEQVYFKTYEEACEAAIIYCLENLI